MSDRNDRCPVCGNPDIVVRGQAWKCFECTHQWGYVEEER